MTINPANFVSACLESYPRCTRSAHPHAVPGWLRYSKDTGSDYVKRLKHLEDRHGRLIAERMVREEMQAHLDGFADGRGNWFCGFCGIWPMNFMEYGQMLGYPDLHLYVTLASTRDCIGYERYLQVVTTASVVVIEDAVRAMKKSILLEQKEQQYG
jgi:hypothetical protein